MYLYTSVFFGFSLTMFNFLSADTPVCMFHTDDNLSIFVFHLKVGISFSLDMFLYL